MVFLYFCPSRIMKQSKYDQAYLKMAQEWAKLSHCQRKKVGALIVKDKMIISEKDLNMVCRDANEKEMRWIEKKPYWNSFSFSPVRNKVKELYKRYFQ